MTQLTQKPAKRSAECAEAIDVFVHPQSGEPLIFDDGGYRCVHSKETVGRVRGGVWTLLRMENTHQVFHINGSKRELSGRFIHNSWTVIKMKWTCVRVFNPVISQGSGA